jgi:hypothetical protein
VNSWASPAIILVSQGSRGSRSIRWLASAAITLLTEAAEVPGYDKEFILPPSHRLVEAEEELEIIRSRCSYHLVMTWRRERKVKGTQPPFVSRCTGTGGSELC